MANDNGHEPLSPKRRTLLRGAMGLAAAGVLASSSAHAAKKQDPRRLPAQTGDILSFPSWENDGRLVHPKDLLVNAAPLLAYPRDPDSDVIRERSRLNQILVMRFSAEELSDDNDVPHVDGIAAYSGLCTHTACGVSEWDAGQRLLLCPCHGSSFDPLKRGVRVAGPAPRALPALPLKLDGEHIVIAGPFTSKVGANA